MVKALGLDGFGALAYRFTLDGNVLRTGMFVAAPAPRQGLMGLLDQPALPPDPPAWVSTDIMAYTHFSADLGAVYTLVKEVVSAAFPDQAPMQFGMIEQQMQAMLQTDPAALLGSLGKRHAMLTFAPRMAKMGSPDGEIAMPANRMAFVWELEDADLWQRTFQVISALTQGAFEFVEEQGFTGLRPKQAPVEMGVFLGKGHLVVAIGSDVAETVLASLSNPPEGDAAFGNSAAMARVRQLQEFEPGLMFQAGDMTRYFEQMAPMITNAFKMGMVQAAPNEEAARVVQGLEEMMPAGEELKGLMGVSGGDVRVNEHGLVGNSFVELPPPGDQ